MKLKPSIAFEDMRGSAGGFTASKNFYRLYAKNRQSPKNPQTVSQQQVRSDLTSNSRNWAALTQAQREAWIEAAKTQMGKSVMGEKAKLTGFNYFVRIAQNLATVGIAYLENPPATMPEFPIFENVFSLPNASGAYYGRYPEEPEMGSVKKIPSLPDGMIWMIRISPAYKPSRQKNPTAVRTYGKLPITETYDAESKTYSYSYDTNSPYNARIPVGLANGRIQSEVYILDTATGITSLRQVAFGTRDEFVSRWADAVYEDVTVNDALVIAGDAETETKKPAKAPVNDPEGGNNEAEFVKRVNRGRPGTRTDRG